MFILGMMALPGDQPATDDRADEKLLEKAGQGDKEAFQELYGNTYRRVYGYVLSIVKDPGDAEEVLQETFVRVWMSCPNYRPQGKPLAWIFTIAKNECRMMFRSRKHDADVDIADLSDQEVADYCPQVENAADREALNAALSLLAEDERSIVLLHASAGMKHREIADAMNLPLSTVLSKYSRAMKKLQKYLGEEG
jgi:RNA polymerase sigma factor (sigma-70 family)